MAAHELHSAATSKVHRMVVVHEGQGGGGSGQPAATQRLEQPAVVLASDGSELLALKNAKLKMLLDLEIALRKIKLEPGAAARDKAVQSLLAPRGLLSRLHGATGTIAALEGSETITFPVVYVTFEYVTAYEMATNDPKSQTPRHAPPRHAPRPKPCPHVHRRLT